MKKITFILVAFLFLVNACGPSIEGETKAWDSNLKSMETAKAKYPKFAETIDQKLVEAKALWEEAKGIKDEDAKAEKMEAANSLLSGGCVGNLSGMNSKISSIQTSIDKVDRLRKGQEGEVKRYAKDAVKVAEKAIEKAKEALNGNSCDDVKRVYKNLSNAGTDLTTAVTKINAAVKEVEAKKDSSKVKETTTTKDTKKVEEVKMVKCPYCSVKNKKTNVKCTGCGATLE